MNIENNDWSRPKTLCQHEQEFIEILQQLSDTLNSAMLVFAKGCENLQKLENLIQYHTKHV